MAATATEPPRHVSVDMELRQLQTTEKDGPLDASALKERSRKKVMLWMESRYPELADALKTTQTSDSFHLAEENKQEFPHEDAVKVTEQMAKFLSDEEPLSNEEPPSDEEPLPKSRAFYLKSMFFCVTPESLIPLAVVMYRKFEELRLKYLHEVYKEYDDKEKVVQLCTCLFVRGLLSDKAQQICRECDNERIQRTVHNMTYSVIDDDDRAPEQLIAASKTAEDVERSFYCAYREWRKIPQTDAVQITEAMVKLLEGDDEEKKKYLESLYFSLDYNAMLPLAITMFQKYREMCPDKLDLLTALYDQRKPRFLGRLLLRRNLLTEEEHDTLIPKKSPEELDFSISKLREDYFEKNNLIEVFEIVLKEPHGIDMLGYHRCRLPYDDAVVIARLMLPFLCDDEQQRKIYVRTMNNISYRKKYWWKDITEQPAGERYLIGELVNVGIIMCTQYLDRYPEKLSEVEEQCFPQYMYSLLGKWMWQRSLLSEVTMSFYVQATLLHQRDESTLYYGLLPLMNLLPTTVYLPVIVNMPEVCDFSTSIWIQSLEPPQKESGVTINPNYGDFLSILVTGAIARERETCNSTEEAGRQVLSKTSENHTLSVSQVDSITTALLKQVPDELRDSYILVARKGPRFADVALNILQWRFNGYEASKLIKDTLIDDQTAAEIISKSLKSELFDDSDRVWLMHPCSEYTGSYGRTATAVVIWKHLGPSFSFFNDVLSAAKRGDVPLAILEEFNIDLYSFFGDEGSNSLHIAAENGFTEFVKLALTRGFTKLLTYSNQENLLPVEVALQHNHYETAAVMLREMNDYKLCIAEHRADDKSVIPAKVRFRKLLEQLQKEDDKDKKESLQECVVAILDSTVDQDGSLIHHEALEVDEFGNTPDKDKYECTSPHSIEIIVKHADNLEDIVAHESFLYIVNRKWELYGWKFFLVPLLSYVFFLIFLTTAFVLGATKGNPSDYSEPLDGFRLFCEIIVFLLTIADILLEIRDFWKNYNRKWRVYFKDWTNWLDILSVLATLLIIPFRIANLNVQWVFVALAYVLHTLRLFEYAVIMSFVAVYVEILVRIIIQDMVQFLIVFIVITISFGGGLFFSLRAEPCPLPQTTTGTGFSPVTNTSLCLHPDETSEIYFSWLTGLRLLIEGSVIDPYIFGDQGFWWFSVIIYMVFLFVVAVILLNLLIAQFSKSYEEVNERARVSVALDRAKILTRLQSSLWVLPYYWCKHLVHHSCMKQPPEKRRKLMSLATFYRASSPYKTDNVNEFEKIHKQFQSTTISDQKKLNAVKDLESQLKEVKTDIASSIRNQESNDYKMTRLSDKVESLSDMVESVRTDLTTQGKVVKQLHSEVGNLVTAHREQTEMILEQQRQMRESLKTLGEVKDVLQQLLHKET